MGSTPTRFPATSPLATASTPTEVEGTFASAGLRQILLASTHGFASGLEESLDDLRLTDPGVYDAALDLLTRTATDSSLLGTAMHLLYLGRTSG
jgi:hypothetical protein